MSKSDDIKAIQQSLNDQGFNAGPVDGIWGPKTVAALKKFQSAHGMQASGRIDAETRTALGVTSTPSRVSSAQ